MENFALVVPWYVFSFPFSKQPLIFMQEVHITFQQRNSLVILSQICMNLEQTATAVSSDLNYQTSPTEQYIPSQTKYDTVQQANLHKSTSTSSEAKG